MSPSHSGFCVGQADFGELSRVACLPLWAAHAFLGSPDGHGARMVAWFGSFEFDARDRGWVAGSLWINRKSLSDIAHAGCRFVPMSL
jgi:hypothetical protein